jgi:hypothetical protein
MYLSNITQVFCMIKKSKTVSGRTAKEIKEYKEGVKINTIEA